MHGKCAKKAMDTLELADLDELSPEGQSFHERLKKTFEKSDIKGFSELMDLFSEAICSHRVNVEEGFSIMKSLREEKEADIIDAARESKDGVRPMILSADLDILADFRDEFLLEFSQEILEHHKKKKVS